ncbi:MAG TPA: TonB-dependent receptor, partial [Vicinamibacterales bacterium]|nr:TonB-dependent receptor [Vicinamibacterales bacterium]
MRHSRLVFVGLFALLLCAASPARAQVVQSGTIEVMVLDSSGGALPGVSVTATAADTTTKRSAVSDSAGKAMVLGLDPSAAYEVVVSLQGFKQAKFDKVLVRSGQTTTINATLAIGGMTESVTVTGTPVVDTRTALQGQDITLRLTESLPTGRSYQSYLQLVPGVMPDDPKKAGNPASKSGINYSDVGGDVGVSTDNFYFFNGINVTDGQTGTFGANLNTEIIQEQKVLTGAIPAEYPGAAGLLTNVITKTGSNRFSGSVNYFLQNDKLVAKNKNSDADKFSTYDTALTLGGPVARDKAWFFGSYRRLSRTDDITALDTKAFLRTVENKQDQTYGKVTWRPTSSDTLSGTYLGDPTDISGRLERDITNAQDRSRVQGGNRFGINYQRIWGSALIDAAYTSHDGEVSDLAVIREASNTVKYRSTDVRTLQDEQRGGFGTDTEDIRSTRGVNGSVQWTWKQHTFKGGAEFGRYGRFLNSTTVGGAVYTSLAAHLSGLTAGEVATGSYSQSLRFDPFNTSDFNGFIATVNAAPNRNAFYAAFDTNANGTITPAELGAALRYNSLANNPQNQVNYYRIAQTQDGAQDFKADGISLYVQDALRLGRFTFNLGVRTERWQHFASEGTKIFTFD